MNNLAPSAGGNNPQQPATGQRGTPGGAASASCVNEFLGDGYQNGFQCETAV